MARPALRPQPPAAGRRWRFIRDYGLRAYLLRSIYYKTKLFPRHIRLKPPHARHSLWCRTKSSDLDAYLQVFIYREYACFDDLADPKLIIDCGANIGCTSIYFLNRFPGAKVIAVEPATGNYEMLRRNLAPYGARVRALHSALWSSAIPMKISETKFADGRDWSFSVEPAASAEKATFTSVGVDDLLRDSGVDRISILKIDIEGAEKSVFADGPPSWISKVDNLCIELHDDEADRLFHEAVARENFLESFSGELVVCRRSPSRVKS